MSARTMTEHTSPVGWYLGSYLLRLFELEDSTKDDPEKRFLSWENTVLVRAESKSHAYEKVVKIGREHDYPYKGGPEGVDVKWEFLGITELLAIYDDIEDGAELLWSESNRKLKNLKGRVLTKHQCLED
ncbi:MAG: DUF4288 domain-containing protein [Paraglaciecola sp.]|uniref:DUF4288 domain-containing protein n=1 Tax=Paraglaciecola sp. TaxID=1920173 RepID=UPI0032993680